jgi:lysophospholipase L1-like esterase
MRKFFCFALFASLFISFTPNKIVTWIAIGDSITYLNDHINETGNRISRGYLSRVIRNIPGLQYSNKGYNGWTAAMIAEKFDELKIDKSDLYTVFLGTNDWWAGRPIGKMDDYLNNTGNGTLYGSYRIIIDKLRNINNKAAIVLITPMQRVDFVYLFDFKNNAYGSYKEKNGQSLAQFAEAINAIAAHEKFPVVDLYNKSGMTLDKLVQFKRLKDPATGLYRNYKYPDFIDIPFNPATDDYPYPKGSGGYTYDGLHPSDDGNDVIAEMLTKVIKEINRK